MTLPVRSLVRIMGYEPSADSFVPNARIVLDTETGNLWRLVGNTPTLMGADGSVSWGAITGTLADQIDLQNALNAKGDMLKSDNLSGLANYTTARSNLGLGTAAVTASTAYATAAQGTTADSALQPAGNGGSLTGLTKTQVGLANVENTSDAGKPVSSAQQTALDLKANLASPTFTGTVGGITAAMVGAPAGSGTSSGTNTGDQTSIVGITGTIAQFNTACTDADFATGGGTATGTNTGDNATNSQYSGLAASKQDTLVSGTNIKTINSASVLGSGNLSVSAADPSYAPGSFTVATETGRVFIKRCRLTTTQRATVSGTARLRMMN